MKKTLIFLSSLIVLAFGCTRVSIDNMANQLYESVLSQSYNYSTLLSTIPESSGPNTKASANDGWTTFSELPLNLQNHIIMYLEGDSFSDWDEFQACRLIAEDVSLSDNEKESLIQGLSAGLALKSLLQDRMQTKGGENEADCRAIYYKKVKSILLGVIGATVGGGIASKSVYGAAGAFVAAATLAIDSIETAGIEYVRCWA